MDKFEQPSAKLLYLIDDMYRLQMIHTVEKNTLKQFVLEEYQAIFELLNKYPTSETELQLADAIVELLRGPNSPTQRIIQIQFTKAPAHSQKVEEEDYQQGQIFEEIQSPLGTQLFKRKQQKQTQNTGGGGSIKLTQVDNTQK
ncbi:hypothetical protein pb186bvf_005397 [Paramecium bursaria]